ncbi:MAG: cobalamin B12-binding domain-containing protein [Elusimicrobia bacterium]|nr:cobalamin B12-binding domain-containing protein [Elusimicrobiota bacterium]
MRALVVAPRFDPHSVSADFKPPIPSGLAYISAALKQAGHEVTCLNLNHQDGPSDSIIGRALADGRFDVVLTGGISVHYPLIKSCVASIRKHAPAARIVLGGGAISSQPALLFELLRPDYLVVGEGDTTVVDLLRCLATGGAPESVKGIGFPGPDGKLALTPAREPIKDLDALPLPDYEGFGIKAHLDHMRPSDSYMLDLFDRPRAYPLIASRSCPFSCTFCFHPIGKTYRQRSIPAIIRELESAIVRYDINIINIYDELFSHDKARVLDFCERVRELARNTHRPLEWNCQLRVDKVDEELLTAMKAAGCYLLSLGIESYSPAVLRSMRKATTPRQIDRALDMVHRAGITVQGNFIFGDIAETVETAHETLAYWRKSVYGGGGLALSHVQPYPGTAIYQRCVEKGLINDEAAFLEDIFARMAKPMNLSDTMAEEDFSQLQEDLYAARRTFSRYVRPLCIEPPAEGGRLTVRCPSCHETSTYGCYFYPKRSVNPIDICCRKCRMRFFLSTPFLRGELFLIELLGAPAVYRLRAMTQSILQMARRMLASFREGHPSS